MAARHDEALDEGPRPRRRARGRFRFRSFRPGCR